MEITKIHTIILDCDGVLTDGKVEYASDGERTKRFNARDVRAIRELISHGYEVVIYTQSSWPGLAYFAERTGALVIIDRDKMKYSAAKPYIMVGDDSPDIDLLRGARLAYCPANAFEVVRDLPFVVKLKCQGGEGVIAELAHILINKDIPNA